MMSIQEFENYIHQKIPVTQSMGFTIGILDPGKVTVHAPLSSNINHRGTAFGGSISSALILACWARLYILLKELQIKGTVVVRSSRVEFIRPVQKDFKAVTGPELIDPASFKDKIKRFSKVKLDLSSTIEENGKILAEFSGAFVVVENSQ